MLKFRGQLYRASRVELSHDHFLLVENPNQELPPDAAKWWAKFKLDQGGDADGVAIATDEDRLIGFARYNLTPEVAKVWDAGTWVDPEFRGLGLGKQLWLEILEQEAPRKVRMDLFSVGGKRLFEYLQKSFPDIDWIAY